MPAILLAIHLLPTIVVPGLLLPSHLIALVAVARVDEA
jgi:hypothetical protein